MDLRRERHQRRGDAGRGLFDIVEGGNPLYQYGYFHAVLVGVVHEDSDFNQEHHQYDDLRIGSTYGVA